MGFSTSISRLAVYYKRSGLGATARRAVVELSRTLFSNGMILFYCDLSGRGLGAADLPSSLMVERIRNETDVSPADLEEIINFWNSKLADRLIKERFRRGASLWIVRSEGRLAGYGWTMQGRTMEPYYFRLGPEDVHLFDFYVFPRFRGQGVNPSLVTDILRNLTAECVGRAFIEAAEWNHAQLASLRKTRFHRLGQATKLTIFRRTIVCWDESETGKLEQVGERKTAATAATARNGVNRTRLANLSSHPAPESACDQYSTRKSLKL
jgi:ribosomal protein S18 acetylase RimI-like enzyme